MNCLKFYFLCIQINELLCMGHNFLVSIVNWWSTTHKKFDLCNKWCGSCLGVLDLRNSKSKGAVRRSFSIQVDHQSKKRGKTKKRWVEVASIDKEEQSIREFGPIQILMENQKSCCWPQHSWNKPLMITMMMMIQNISKTEIIMIISRYSQYFHKSTIDSFFLSYKAKWIWL